MFAVGGEVIRVNPFHTTPTANLGYFLSLFFYRSQKRLSKMSKSRRVFLSIQGNDDFWGNGDRFEEERAKKPQRKMRIVEDDDEEEMKEKYFFKQSNIERQRMQQIQEEEEEARFEEKHWKVPETTVDRGETKKMFGADHNPFEMPPPEKTASKPAIVSVSFEKTDTFYSNYRSFFRSRPEVRSLVLCIDEKAPDTYDNEFIDLYEMTRKRIEGLPHNKINQILRRTCPNTIPAAAEQRARNRQTVVVSNFREPDRRLGRYSKYYYHHNVGPEVYSRKVFVGGLPTFVTEADMVNFFSRYGRLQVDWPSKHYGSCKSDSEPSVCNEAISTPMRTPSNLGMHSSPFGHNNSFASDYPPRQPEPPAPMNNFGRQSSGGGFSNPGGFPGNFGRNSDDGRKPHGPGGFASPGGLSNFGGNSGNGGFANPGGVSPFGNNSNFGGFSNPGRASNSGGFPNAGGFSSPFGGPSRHSGGPPVAGRFANLGAPSPRNMSFNEEYENCGDSSGFGSGPGFRGDVCSVEKKPQHLGYVFLLFEKERSVRDLVAECFEEEEGLFITLESAIEPTRVQIRPWLLADAEFLMDFNVPINTKLVAFIGGVPRPLKAVELAHFFEQTYGNVVCVGIDIDNKFKYPRGSGRVAFSNYDAYVQAITDRYIILDHEDIHKRVEIKPYFFHNQSCEECSGRYHRQHAPFFCPSLECFQYYCEPCWEKMHAHPSRFHHQPVVKGV